MRIVETAHTFSLSGVGRSILENLPFAARALAEAVAASSDPYVPYRTGRLAKSAVIEQDGEGPAARVCWTAPYAAECYRAERPFRKTVHPLATARWFEAAKSADAGLWRDLAAEALLAGGKDGV